jgi:hypothetical protein
LLAFPFLVDAQIEKPTPKKHEKSDKAGARPESYFTLSKDFADVSRGFDLEIGGLRRSRASDDAGRPKAWPLRLTSAQWMAVLPRLAKREYTFRCRSIDEKGNAQPIPRPFKKSGHASIDYIKIAVKD